MDHDFEYIREMVYIAKIIVSNSASNKIYEDLLKDIWNYKDSIFIKYCLL